MSGKKWTFFTIGLTCILIVLGGVINIVVDPFFHFHKPLDILEYPMEMDNERYINNGIIKNFEYDAIITGTSLTENFKTTEFNYIFNVNSIKVPFSGGTYKEVNDIIKQSLEVNKNVVCVLRCLDYSMLIMDKNKVKYDTYPVYLYDDVLFNDVKYFFSNKTLINTLKVIDNTIEGNSATSFDEYANWNEYHIFTKEAVLGTYNRPDGIYEVSNLSESEKTMVVENVTENITNTAKENPSITFYYYFSPYSICYWDQVLRKGEIDKHLEAEKIAIELILQCDNIKLYSFDMEKQLITDLDNYKDIAHYSEDINSKIIKWISEGYGLLTYENYENYLNEKALFIREYDYDKIFN